VVDSAVAVEAEDTVEEAVDMVVSFFLSSAAFLWSGIHGGC